MDFNPHKSWFFFRKHLKPALFTSTLASSRSSCSLHCATIYQSICGIVSISINVNYITQVVLHLHKIHTKWGPSHKNTAAPGGCSIQHPASPVNIIPAFLSSKRFVSWYCSEDLSVITQQGQKQT